MKPAGLSLNSAQFLSNQRGPPHNRSKGRWLIRPAGSKNRYKEQGIAMATNSTGTFQWADPLLLDAQLTDDERLIAKTARDFAQEKLSPRIVEAYLAGENRPRDLSSKWASLGCSA